MAQSEPEPGQRPMTDDEIDEGRQRLREFFDEVTEDLADEFEVRL